MASSNNNASVVVDSFAWIEYFAGTKPGEKAARYIESGQAITPTIVVAELSAKYSSLQQDFASKLKFITLKSRIIALDEQIAVEAGAINVERKRKIARWGMVDSIILATARAQKASVLTGDEHFRDLEEERAIMIK
jgi:predicted nucleic acid-binding protein